MNQHTLIIKAHDKPTVMEKLLQVARYRGFSVSGMTMFPSGESSMLNIELSVFSDNSIEKLKDQLNKLIDIKDISVDNAAVLKRQA